MVVQGSHDTDLVQPFRVAVIVLDGVGVGLHHVGTLDDVLGSMGTSLQEVIVIAVHAGNHVLAQLLAELVHQYGFLAFGQRCLGRQHLFEVTGVVFIFREDGSPERNIIVAFHISHDFSSRTFGLEAVGRSNVQGRKVLSQSFSHTATSF